MAGTHGGGHRLDLLYDVHAFRHLAEHGGGDHRGQGRRGEAFTGRARLTRAGVVEPEAGDKVLIEVHAAGVTYPEVLQSRGEYQFKPDLPFVPGSDACGEVVEAGPGVTRFEPGDRAVPTYTQGWISGLPR